MIYYVPIYSKQVTMNDAVLLFNLMKKEFDRKTYRIQIMDTVRIKHPDQELDGRKRITTSKHVEV